VTPPEVGAGVTGPASVFHHSAVVGSKLKCSQNLTDASSRMVVTFQGRDRGNYISAGVKLCIACTAVLVN